MNRQYPETLEYYDIEVVKKIVEHDHCDPMQAFKQFVHSKTHQMLEDQDYGMTTFGAGAVFEIWQAEHTTGDPRNCSYIKED